MAYLAPKTDWTSVDGVLSTDLNRIEGNIETLATLRGYPTATGTGTAIAVTTGHFELVAGRSFTFIASANNSGAATTINADGTGAKNLYKPNTTDAPTIISGKAYTVWYNGTSFFVKASAEGDAVAGDVIKDKTFSNDEDTGITGTLELTGNAAVGDVLATKTFYNTDPKTKRTGTMPNRGTVSTDISAKATEVTIAQGYHSGSGKVKIATAEQNKIITGNIKSGITVLGVAGKSSVVDTADADAVAGDILDGKTGYVNGSKITGNIPSKGAATYTPGTTDQTINAGQYLSGAQTIAGDADLVAGNIKTGVGIFGVTGTFTGGIKTIQFGESARSASQANITLGTEIESDNSFVIIKSITVDETDVSFVRLGKYLVGLTDTTLSLSAGDGCQYIVIEFQPGAVKSIQRGTITGTISTAQTTVNHSSVDVAKSFILLDSSIIGFPTICKLAHISSRTTTSFVCNNNFYYDAEPFYSTASYQIVEFN
jgi:hypothetical protein